MTSLTTPVHQWQGVFPYENRGSRRISHTRVQQVSVGEIKIGSVKIDQLLLSNMHVQASTGIAQMRNVRLVLTLQFGLDWRIGVKISMPDGIPDVVSPNRELSIWGRSRSASVWGT